MKFSCIAISLSAMAVMCASAVAQTPNISGSEFQSATPGKTIVGFEIGCLDAGGIWRPQTSSGSQCPFGGGSSGGSVTQGTVPWVVSGQGAAGTPASGVVTVQGIAGGTPLIVSQATAANLNATVVGTGTFAVQSASTDNLTQLAGTTLGAPTAYGSAPSGNVIGVNANILASVLPAGAATSSNQAAMQAPITPGSATATKSEIFGFQYNSTQSTFTNGQQGAAQGSANGALYVATGVDPFAIQGNVAAGSSDSGPPIKIGGIFTSSLPSLSTGQRGNLQLTSSGVLMVTPVTALTGSTIITAAPTDNWANGAGQTSQSQNLLTNGSGNWNKARDVTGAVTSGTGTAAVGLTPTSASTGAISPVKTSGTNATSLILKASAGNLYSVNAINSTANAGFCVLIDSATVPTVGATITYVNAAILAANGQCTLGTDAGIPTSFTSGIVLLLSTNLATYTVASGPTGLISGKPQ